MLVLRRKCGQSVIINVDGKKITVKVLRENDGVITLGVGAPKCIKVDREEVFLKQQKNDSVFDFSEIQAEN